MLFHASVFVSHNHDHAAVILVLVTVAGRAEYCEKHSVGEVLISVLNALMSPDDELEVVVSAELLHPVGSESACAVASGA